VSGDRDRHQENSCSGTGADGVKLFTMIIFYSLLPTNGVRGARLTPINRSPLMVQSSTPGVCSTALMELPPLSGISSDVFPGVSSVVSLVNGGGELGGTLEDESGDELGGRGG
jgi:hypothetical protein